MATSSHDRSHACISQARDGCFGDLSDGALGQMAPSRSKSSQLDVLFDEFSSKHFLSISEDITAKALDDAFIL